MSKLHHPDTSAPSADFASPDDSCCEANASLAVRDERVALGASPGGLPDLRMAVIDDNMLACMGMVSLLQKVAPMVTVQSFHRFEDIPQDEDEKFVHYFVSARIFFEHSAFFRRKPYQSIVLTAGENLPPMSGVLTLNICRSEQALITDLLQLHQQGHGSRPQQAHLARLRTASQRHPMADRSAVVLTTREIEVLTLLAQGLINKEVAHRLCIGLTTVITHRKNIMSKLGANSLSDLIIYAVMNGYLQLGK